MSSYFFRIPPSQMNSAFLKISKDRLFIAGFWLSFTIAVLAAGIVIPAWKLYQQNGGLSAAMSQDVIPIIPTNHRYQTFQFPLPLPGNALPMYPLDAQKAGRSGKLIAHIEVNAKGNVEHITMIPVEPDVGPELKQAAIEALQTWHFKPATRDGKPVSGSIQIPIEFPAN